jgi:hypothetical protein
VNRNLLGLVGLIDGIVTSLLWGVLALAIIRTFSLQQVWYIVCVLVAAAMAAQQFLHQIVALPGVLRELGYEINDSVRSKMKFRWSESLMFAVVMSACAYFGVPSGHL